MQGGQVVEAYAAVPWSQVIGLGFIGFGCAAFAGALLAFIFGRHAVAAAKERALRRRAESANGFLDVAFVDGLALASSPDRAEALFKAIAEDCRGRLDDIWDAVNSGDLYRMQTESESLAESCEAFGATGLARESRRLLVAVRDRAFDDAARILVDIDNLARRTFDAMAARAEIRKQG